MATALLVLVLGVTAFGILAAPWLVSLFPKASAEAVLLTRIMFPYLALVSAAAFFQGILNSVGVFAPSGAAPIAFNVAWIVVPWALMPFLPDAAQAMAVGVLLGGVAQALWQLPALLRTGWRFGLIAPGPAFRDPGVRRVFRLIGPTIVGMAAYQLNELVCTAVAFGAGEGVATGLSFSLRLLELILGIFAVSAGTVLLPELSDAASRADWSRFRDRLRGALDAIALVTLPVAFFSLIMGREIVALLFQARAFDESSVELTTGIFFFHMLGLFFIAANRLLAPAFYARGDSRSPAVAGIIAFALNIVLAIVLARLMGGRGIALALSVSSALNSLFLVILLLRAGIEGLGSSLRASFRYAGGILGLSLLASAPLLLLRPFLRDCFAGASGRFLRAGAPLLIGALLYALIGVGGLLLTRDATAARLLRGLSRRRARG
jgi:putative peptidoglycan lipid II flippase